MPPSMFADPEMPLEDPFRAAFDGAPLPMWVMDPGQLVLEANRALCAMLEQPLGRVIGSPLSAFTHADERDANERWLGAVLSGERETIQRETRMLRADGSAIWVVMSIAILRSADTGPTLLIGQAYDITARRQHEQRLQHLAEHDPLTGLLNRRGFDRSLRLHVSRSRRYGPRGALLMLDLDDFKGYNDRYGHGAGDELLREVAAVLAGRLRAGDVVGRIGGDEFAALLPEASTEQAGVVAEALTQAVRASLHHGRHATVSIGVFSFAGADKAGISDTGAMVNADVAMYAAKQAGRDGYAHFDADPPPAQALAGESTPKRDG